MMTDANSRPRQIPLDLPWPRHERATRADFAVSTSNAAALGFVEGWRDWPDNRLCLVGPEGSGKTHLAMIWAQETDAVFVQASDVDARGISNSGRVIFEDCDRRLQSPDQEHALFHLLNILREEGGSILMTARTPPARWGTALPDLASRLTATAVARVEPPDDDLLEMLVVKLFSDRDIVVKEGLVTYISRRIERNAAAVENAVAALDAKSLETGAPISTRMAKELFGW